MFENNKQENLCRIEAFNGNTWVDVTDREAIIYGAGNGCFEMMDDLLLPNVSLVVDGSSEMQGKQIVLMSKAYEICSPCIITKMDKSKVFIVVSSERFFDEIRADIRRIIGEEFLVCGWREGIRYCYKSLEAMLFMDNCIKQKLEKSKLTKHVYEIVDDYNHLKDAMDPVPFVDRYIPLRKGWSKFSFIFGNINKLWVFHKTGYVNSNEERLIERENPEYRRIRQEYLDYYGIDSLLIVGKQHNAMIQHYAGQIPDFSCDSVRKKVFMGMRKLHECPASNLPDCDFVRTFYWDWVKRGEQYKSLWEKSDYFDAIKEFGDKKAIFIENHTNHRCAVHGDLTLENIVSFNEDICFIDWDFLSAGFPEIDICYFLFSIHFLDYSKGIIDYLSMCKFCYDGISSALECYYNEDIDIGKNTQIAYATMDLYVLRDILQTFYRNINLGIEKFDTFISIRENHLLY